MVLDTIGPYDRGFREFTSAYEAFGFEDIHKGALPFLPAAAGLALDVGAGSGRDAAWFASRGWEVVAVEPAAGMREEASRVHRSPGIRWFDDRALRRGRQRRENEPERRPEKRSGDDV